MWVLSQTEPSCKWLGWSLLQLLCSQQSGNTDYYLNQTVPYQPDLYFTALWKRAFTFSVWQICIRAKSSFHSGSQQSECFSSRSAVDRTTLKSASFSDKTKRREVHLRPDMKRKCMTCPLDPTRPWVWPKTQTNQRRITLLNVPLGGNRTAAILFPV